METFGSPARGPRTSQKHNRASSVCQHSPGITLSVNTDLCKFHSNDIVYSHEESPKNRPDTKTDGTLDTDNLLYWRCSHMGDISSPGRNEEQIETMQTCM